MIPAGHTRHVSCVYDYNMHVLVWVFETLVVIWLIYVFLEHLIDCFLVAVGQLWLSRVFMSLSSLKKFVPIFSRFSCFPSQCSRYAARFIPCFYESLPSDYNPFHLHHVLLSLIPSYNLFLIVDFYHTGCQVELVVMFVGIETMFGIDMMMNLHHRLLRRKS